MDNLENIITELIVLRENMENIKDLAIESDMKTFNLMHLLQISLDKTIHELDKLIHEGY